MYTDYFKLKDEPFRVTPDTHFFFSQQDYAEVIEQLLARVSDGAGITVLSGPAGSGKSLVLRWLITKLGAQTPTAFVGNANLSFDDFLSAVCSDLDLPETGPTRAERLAAIEAFCGRELTRGRRPVLLVDEAGNLGDDVLENLSSLAVLGEDGKPLLAIVLAADEAGTVHLTVSALGPLLGPEILLRPLARDQVAGYVNYRLQVAGCPADQQLFSADAIDRLAELSHGIPRVINNICGKVLLEAFLSQERVVSQAMIEMVAAELGLSVIDEAPAFSPESQTLPERWEAAFHPSAKAQPKDQARGRDATRTKEGSSFAESGVEIDDTPTLEREIPLVDMDAVAKAMSAEREAQQRRRPAGPRRTAAKQTEPVFGDLTAFAVSAKSARPDHDHSRTHATDEAVPVLDLILEFEAPSGAEFSNEPPEFNVRARVAEQVNAVDTAATDESITDDHGVTPVARGRRRGVQVAMILVLLAVLGAGVLFALGPRQPWLQQSQLVIAEWRDRALDWIKAFKMSRGDEETRAQGVVGKLENGSPSAAPEQPADAAVIAEAPTMSEIPAGQVASAPLAAADVVALDGPVAPLPGSAYRNVVEGAVSKRGASGVDVDRPSTAGSRVSQDGQDVGPSDPLLPAERVSRVTAATAADAGEDEGFVERERRVDLLLQLANEHLSMRRYTIPIGNNAYEIYMEALELIPNHRDALAGIREIRDRYSLWASLAERRGNWERADLYYRKALKLDPEDDMLRDAARRAGERLERGR